MMMIGEIPIKNQGRTMMLGQDVFWYVKARNSWRYLTITATKIHENLKMQWLFEKNESNNYRMV